MKYAQSPETQQYLVRFWNRHTCFAEVTVASNPTDKHQGALILARQTREAREVAAKYGSEIVYADVILHNHPWDREMFVRTEMNGHWTRIVPSSEQELEAQILSLSDNYDTLDARVTALETEVGIHATRLDTVEGQTGVLIAQVGALETQADDFEERIADLEDNLLGGWL